jgi:Radical SAM superfamily
VILADILDRRPLPGSGVLFELTRRCPLSCLHCATNSSHSSPDGTPDDFLDFVRSFRSDNHPDVILMSGGEPLLHPLLVQELAVLARSAGTRSSLLTGAFFVRDGRRPPAVMAALEAVDHVAVSLDVFHEREVPRDEVLRLLGDLLERGKDVSVQIVATGPDDPYPPEVTAELGRLFGDRVPALVVPLGSAGRAARNGLSAASRALPPAVPSPSPCVMAAWPLVTCDGTVTACCNHHVVERPGPSHLVLGHARDGWPAIRSRCLESALLRAIRLYGPQYVMAWQGERPPSSYCGACRSLSRSAPLERRAEDLMALPVSRAGEALLREMATDGGARMFADAHGVPGHGHLVQQGGATGEPSCG